QNCNNINPDFASTFPTPPALASGRFVVPNPLPPDNLFGQTDCFADGEASLAVRRELAQGAVNTSLLGYTLSYNTLDNNRNPTAGLFAELKQDFAGVGGDVQYIRTTGDVRSYYEVFSDVIALLHLQGGLMTSWKCGGIVPKAGEECIRMLDH